MATHFPRVTSPRVHGTPQASRSPRSLAGRLLAGAFTLALALVPACSTWDKYWEEDTGPAGPGSSDTTPPVVALATPSGPDSLHATPVSGAAYDVVVDVADDGTVAAVQVYVDDVALAEILHPPWGISWNTTTLGEASHHRLRATAVDAAGNVGESGIAWAQVFNAGPPVVLLEPSDQARVRGSVHVAVDFPDAVPDIATVEFLADVFSVGMATAPPWAIDLDTTTLAAGSHYLAAKATTVLGHVGVSAPVRVYVNNGTPTASISFPLSGHQVASAGTLVLIGSGHDDVEGNLAPEQIAWRSSRQGLLGTGNELRKSGLVPGSHTIFAVATNSWGAMDSVQVQVQVALHATVSYCNEIHWPLLETCFCTFCHNPGSSEYPTSELDLRSYDSLMHGGKSQDIYECVYPCRPESSLIYNKITAETPWVGGKMPVPPTFPPVPADVAEKLRLWILEGAPPDEMSADCR